MSPIRKNSRSASLRLARGPLKLKPTLTHKSKKAYNRKKSKKELKSLFN